MDMVRDRPYLSPLLQLFIHDAGTEATRWIVNHAFEQLGKHRVSLGVIGDNPRAITLYENMCAVFSLPSFPFKRACRGFVEEGRERKANYQDGKWWDIVSMGILEEDWKRDTQ
jgi:RimJ/RimL family protein N-acetyltransferase